MAIAALESPVLEEEDEDTGRRSSDKELLVVGHILRKLGTLEDDAARCRVMDYLYSRFVASRKPL